MAALPPSSQQLHVEEIMRRRLEGYGRDPLLIVQDYQLEQQVSADYATSLASTTAGK